METNAFHNLEMSSIPEPKIPSRGDWRSILFNTSSVWLTLKQKRRDLFTEAITTKKV